jgi:catechol 2,3-dioxygenase-like lactoylglutathione lyase family enzyme
VAGLGVDDMATIAGAHHIGFTVRDIERSTAWYSDLLGLQTLLSVDNDEVSVRVLADASSGWIVGLRQYHQRPDQEFSEFRTGLDHFAFGVSSADELAAWEGELAARSITFTPIAETPIGTVIAFRDPDNIQLEFWLPIGS